MRLPAGTPKRGDFETLSRVDAVPTRLAIDHLARAVTGAPVEALHAISGCVSASCGDPMRREPIGGRSLRWTPFFEGPRCSARIVDLSGGAHVDGDARRLGRLAGEAAQREQECDRTRGRTVEHAWKTERQRGLPPLERSKVLATIHLANLARARLAINARFLGRDAFVRPDRDVLGPDERASGRYFRAKSFGLMNVEMSELGVHGSARRRARSALVHLRALGAT